MTDLETVKDASQSLEVNGVAFIRIAYNIAYALTEVEGHSALMDTLTFRKLNYPVQQRIL